MSVDNVHDRHRICGRRNCGQAGVVLLFVVAAAIGPPDNVSAQTAMAEPALSPRSRPAVSEPARLPYARPPDAPSPKALEAGSRRGTDKTCLARLGSLGVKYAITAPITDSDGCRVPEPMAIIEIAPGVRLIPESRLNCQTTKALAIWVHDVVLPAAAAEFGSRPTALIHDSTYVCRRRNNRPDGKRSEHATGNAIDIRAIALAGRNALPIRIWNETAIAERQFQARLRKGACKVFTTVLGPGTNAAHATHFHFDLARRKNGYRLCE